MSKSIYEEALQELKDATTDLEDLEIIHSYDVNKIETALKQAQKQDKLLGLYRRLYKDFDDLTLDEQLEIEKQIKELENE